MFCTKCGKKLKEGALFCTQCGANASRRLYVAPTPIVQPQPIVEEREIISQAIEQQPIVDVQPIEQPVIEEQPIVEQIVQPVVEEVQQVVEVQPEQVLEQEKREPVNHVGICPHCGMTVTLYPVYEQPTQPIEQTIEEEPIAEQIVQPMEQIEEQALESASQPTYMQSEVQEESAPVVKTRFSILSIIGFSLSIIATLLIFFSHYIVYIIGIACAISALVVSIIGTIRASKNGQQLKVLGILGIAFGIATTIYYTYIWILVLTMLSGFGII